MNLLLKKKFLNIECLEGFGFKDIETYKMEKELNDDNVLFYASNYFIKTMNHSRRGQWYYMLINKKTQGIELFASEPDGSGGLSKLDDTIYHLIKNDMIEPI